MLPCNANSVERKCESAVPVRSLRCMSILLYPKRFITEVGSVVVFGRRYFAQGSKGFACVYDCAQMRSSVHVSFV